MYDTPVNPEKKDEKKKPTARLTMHKDHASKVKVGDEMKMHVKGKVKGINQSYDHPDHYDVEMEDAETEPMDSESKEDENMATMPREKLKKKIMPKDGE